jgi:Fic family protein
MIVIVSLDMAATGCLVGSPYLLPSEGRAREQVRVLLERENRARERLAGAQRALRRMNLESATNRYQATREIYESNAIEGLGPDLQGTWQILESDIARRLDASFNAQLLAKSITADADMNAVLGLHGARLLASRLQQDSSRPWSESDLRSLHETICAGESFAGMYKRYHVKISGEESHEPHLPIDVSRSMHELVTWWATATSGPAVIRAAAVHAWLTHIHPFEDGNGRLARILANVTLLRSGLAPAIVKHSNQRGPYLDALRHSDYGGDILPLANLFLSVVVRYAREISKPKTLREVFFEELNRREQGLYSWWQGAFSEFLVALHTSLRFEGLTVHTHGELDYESFQFLQNLDSSGNAWLESIKDAAGHEILFWFGYPSINMRRENEKVPSLFVSVPDNEQWSMRPFRSPKDDEVFGLTEIMLIPGMRSRVYTMQNDRQRYGDISDAADEIADIIGSAFRQGHVPVKLSKSAEVRE